MEITRHRALRWATILTLAASTVGCGAVTCEDGACEAEVPVLPPDAAPPLSECAAPLVVFQGNAWVAGLRWAGGRIVPNACHDPGGHLWQLRPWS